MTKKTNEIISQWRQMIESIGDENNKNDKILKPDRLEVKYILDYANLIQQRTEKLAYIHELVNCQYMGMDIGQELINIHKKEIKKYAANLIGLIEQSEEEVV